MKSITNTFTLLLFSFIFSLTLSAQSHTEIAQDLFKNKIHQFKEHNLATQINVRTGVPLNFSQAKTRPEAIKSRLRAYRAHIDFDGLTIGDSTLLFWPEGVGDERMAESLITSFDLFISYPGDLRFFNMPLLTAEVDSTLYIESMFGMPWEESQKMINETIEAGKIKQRTSWAKKNSEWVNDFKHIYEYNTKGLVEKITGYQWKNDDWTLFQEFTYGYNNDGKVILDQQVELSESGDIIYGTKNENEYNNQGALIKQSRYQWNEDESVWEAYYHAYAEYDNDKVIKEFFEEKDEDSDEFEKAEQFVYIYDNAGLISHLEYYFYIGSWVKVAEILYEREGTNVSKATLAGPPDTEFTGKFTHNEYGQCTSYFIEVIEDGSPINVDFYFYYEDYDDTSDAKNPVISESDIQIFPNPALDYIIVSLEEDNINSIRIYDINGRIIQEITSRAFDAEYKISLDNMNSGTYFLEINSGDKKGVKKFIKQ